MGLQDSNPEEETRVNERTPVEIVPWSGGHLELLRRMNAPEMTEHLGGPETEAQVAERHERYMRIAQKGTGRMFAVVLLPERELAGSVGYWERNWQGRQVCEMGWGILPAYQGRGLATAAVAQAIEAVRAQGARRTIHAYPGAGNPASNAVCRKLGFTLIGEIEFEYPPGSWMRCNDWRLAL
ncbi:GNAT family N-acetyltransferase [Cohnella rhizosphaerae]|uniref:GNAT family N-acetyltransferase n=1 Tax=Cohnella rhizosphaerae TaxID=1457232 RepID=A0A9X4KRF4_9BACL|nr:GNAT family N-acetyltransferase [Cohnella rhizosphaerae]MDG0809298.1 GNAT family N-acetyltransferase [Cohnella rhizosphaerae]